MSVAAGIPSYVALPTPVAVVLLLGALATAILGLARLTQKTGIGLGWLRAKTVEPERQDIDALHEMLDEVLAELRPNGGSSLRDGQDRIETKLDSHIDHSTADRAYLHERLNGTIAENELVDPDEV